MFRISLPAGIARSLSPQPRKSGYKQPKSLEWIFFISVSENIPTRLVDLEKIFVMPAVGGFSLFFRILHQVDSWKKRSGLVRFRSQF